MKTIFFAVSLAAIAFLAPRTSAAREGENTTAFVRLHGSEGIRLETRDASATPWRVACEMPCDAELPTEPEYRVTGAQGAVLADAFHLKATAGADVVINVTSADKGRKRKGAAFVALGAALIVGSVVSTWALQRAAEDSARCHSSKDYDDSCIGGGVSAAFIHFFQIYTVLGGVAGVAALSGGVYAIATPGTSMVQYTDEPPSPEAYVRRPTWTRPVATAPAGVVVPLSFSF